MNSDQEKFFLHKLASIEGKLDSILQLFLKAATRDTREDPVVTEPPERPPRDIYSPQDKL